MSNHSDVCEAPDRASGVRGAGVGLNSTGSLPSDFALQGAVARTPDGPFADLLAAVARFRSRPATDYPADDTSRLLDDLVLLRHACDLLELAFAPLAARFEDIEGRFAIGGRDVTPLFTLRTSCHMTSTAAADAICIGERAASLPLSTAALEQGRIGLPQLALLARTSHELWFAPEPVTFDEPRLLALAERLPLRRFRRECAHARHAADRATFLRDQQACADARWLDVRPLSNDAGYDVRGYLDPVGGAAVHAVLNALARPCGEGDHRDRRHRLGDAAVELCSHVLDEGGIFTGASAEEPAEETASAEDSASPASPAVAAMAESRPSPVITTNIPSAALVPARVLRSLDLAAPRRAPWGGPTDPQERVDPLLWDPLPPPRSAGPPEGPPTTWAPAEIGASGRAPRRRHAPHLVVSTTIETLLGLPGAPAGELDGVPVAAETVVRFACNASVSRIVFGPASAVVDVGRERRVPSPAARRVVVRRDRGCVWPGCDRPARWTQVHHLDHWAHDGSSDPGNLCLVCYRHHVKVHEEGWHLVLTDHGVVAIPPLPEYPYIGRPLHSEPAPAA